MRSFLRSWSILSYMPFARATPGSSAALRGSPDPDTASRTRRDPRTRASLKAATAEGVVAELVGACTGAAVLTGWALWLGCSPFFIGVLGALPFLSQMLQIPAVWLTSRAGHRPTAIVCVAISRQVWLPLAMLPWLPASIGPALLLLAALANNVFGVLGNNAWSAWMGELIPASLRGRYFGKRTAVCALGGTIASLFAGFVLDGAKQGQATALSALAVVAWIAGLVTIAFMRRQHDPGGETPPKPDLASVLAPFRDPRVRPYLRYVFAWNAAVGITSAFVAYHMLHNLRAGFAVVAVHAAGTALVRMLAAPVWGRVIDRVGARPVLIASSFGISLIPFVWLFSTPDRLWPIAFDALIAGSLWSAHGLATFALPLAVTPRAERRFYLAAFSMTAGVAFTITSMLAGAIASAMPVQLVVAGHAFFGLNTLHFLGFFARFGAASLARRIVQPGAKSLETMLPVLGTEIVGGVRRVPLLDRWR